MSIKVVLDSRKSACTKPVIHHMPCKIECDGNAKVGNYFTTGIRSDKTKEGGEYFSLALPLALDLLTWTSWRLAFAWNCWFCLYRSMVFVSTPDPLHINP